MSKKTFVILFAVITAAILGIFWANNNAGVHQPLPHGGLTHRQINQLFALFLDWMIWLLALCLCLFSNILRDSVGDASKIQGQNYANKALALAGGPMAEPVEPPYSLAKTQLVIWITIIASVYTYAILWDGRDIGSINQTALILMGISAGTFAAAAIVDTTEIQQGIPRTQDEPSSKNFFTDILSDAQGISIHRFQNFVYARCRFYILLPLCQSADRPGKRTAHSGQHPPRAHRDQQRHLSHAKDPGKCGTPAELVRTLNDHPRRLSQHGTDGASKDGSHHFSECRRGHYRSVRE